MRLKKKWGDKDLADFLSSGLTPDGDVPAEAAGRRVRQLVQLPFRFDLSRFELE